MKTLFTALCLCIVSAGVLHAGAPGRVLMIGDSLSVGAFGPDVYRYLAARCGRQNVALYASCGSAPEHWLAGEPTFYTRCGFREQTPARSALIDFVNGHAPPPVATPKLESLLDRYRPKAVLVQLGTNWMDRAGGADAALKRSEVLDRMAGALRNGAVHTVIWISPPDSSHFSKSTQQSVQDSIRDAAMRHGFEVVDSRKYTHYVHGVTGGDGIHYHDKASHEWAEGVERELDRKLR